MRIYGVTGWKDQGKTTLVTRLVAHFAAAGLRVATVKHAHHAFDVDHEGRDSYRHREAGASEVLLASRRRVALMRELRGAPEPELADLLPLLSPCDLVLVEGYKNAPHRKVEVYRDPRGRPPLALDVPSIRAIAGDPGAHDTGLPVLALDDTAAIAAFILSDAEAIR